MNMPQLKSSAVQLRRSPAIWRKSSPSSSSIELSWRMNFWKCWIPTCSAISRTVILFHRSLGICAVVHGQDAGLLAEALLLDAIGPELGLPRRQGDAGGIRPVVLRHVGHQGAPAAADVEQPLAALELDLLCHHLQLAALRVLQRVVGFSKKRRGVDHHLAEEGVEEVVAPVVVEGDGLLVGGGGVHQHRGEEAAHQELQVLEGQPVVENLLLPPQERLQVTGDLDVPGDVPLDEGGHGELAPVGVGGCEINRGRGHGGLQSRLHVNSYGTGGRFSKGLGGGSPLTPGGTSSACGPLGG